ncbi:MAG: hypothetical protein WCY87_05865 [Candidatus Cloacimonadales bacterium]|jgi:hypothetical protein|nr:hypothetical protein [Candidatus Cloacimonadota bacterium]MDY0381985.1 hypothetical protein [Candidatus Cloacimonadaceae bacterium]MCB5257091.1 hypothetical protein [Candidatus Cloacimonadota bacterium]MCB5264541.1 hypothetical protein [Candidatus Cloacimonadota bacterium]MCB5277542.1 hypothetical protein [Candidatus Cloacimonadota bacterium]
MKTAKLLLMALILFFGACRNPFRPPLIDNSSSVVHNRSPEELLRNLEKAYREKNINIFKQLLHPNYRFELLSSEYSQIGIDMDGDGRKDDWWGYDEEVALTQNMFELGSSDGTLPVADEIELRLQIPPQDLWESDPAEGREGWIIVPCYFDLILSYGYNNSSYIANGMARFYLLEEKASWKIIIWRDESLL